MQALQAHLRLLAILPVRTIEAKPRLVGRGYLVTEAQRREMRRLKKYGMTNRKIADELGISRAAVGRNLSK